MLSFCNLKDIFKDNVKKLIVFVSFIVIFQFIMGGGILHKYSEHLNHQLKTVNKLHDKFTVEEACEVVNCKSMSYIKNPTHYLVSDGTYITKDLEFVIYNKELNSYFLLDLSEVERELIKKAIILTLILFLITFLFVLFNMREQKEKAIRDSAGNEALLTNKSMILITENIHHELNTPMEVIDNKINKIHKILNEFTLKEYENWSEHYEDEDNTFDDFKLNERRYFNKKILQFEEDFSYIKQSSEQIYAVLDRMRGFKHLRYSNGNKSIANILEGSFKVISISNSNFEFNVDEELRKYTINSETFKNADLLNITINHIKNSLEANASKIHILFEKFDGSYLRFRIIDNGNGIKNVDKKKIFAPNFSTKDICGNGLRGNGLYLNKSILKSDGGDVKLIDSSNYGTTFEIKIPAKTGEWGRLYEN